MRADVDAADAGQHAVDEGEKRPSAWAPPRRWCIGRRRRWRRRNGIVHGDPFELKSRPGASSYTSLAGLISGWDIEKLQVFRLTAA